MHKLLVLHRQSMVTAFSARGTVFDMRRHSVIHRFALAALATLSMAWAATPCRADLIPPRAAEALTRYQDNPKAFDQADAYCAKKKPGAACSIPGNAFEGGGAGRCERHIEPGSDTIDLQCQRSERITIDRRLPAGDFLANAYACAQSPRDPGHNCSEAPLVPDRFCSGRSAGQACSVELTRDGRNETYAGVCTRGEQVESFYYQGRRTARRPILSCEPVNKAPERVYTPASSWERLGQW
jgi:hypothetical protein